MAKQDEFLRFEITNTQRENATARHKEVGTLGGEQTKHFDDQRAKFGYLGEELFHAAFPKAIRLDGDRNADFELDGYRVEIKTRSYITTKPLYEWTPYSQSKNIQLADLFVFVMVHQHMERGFIAGWLTRAEMIAKAEAVRAGDQCRESHDKRYLFDGYRITSDMLHPFDKEKLKI